MLVCFHGFGQQGSDFCSNAKAHPQYKFIAVSLFFHGESKWQSTEPLAKKDLIPILEALIKTEKISTFSVLGYSMGGRFALATLELFPNLINHIYLLAPDGLINDRWYRFVTANKLQRRIFHHFMRSPNLLLKLVTSARKIGILNKGLHKFVIKYLGHKSERMKIYNTWTLFRNLNMPPKKFKHMLEVNGIKASLVLGEFDRIMKAEKFRKELAENDFLKFEIVQLTHNNLFYYHFSS